MKLAVFDQFLTRQSAQIPAPPQGMNRWKAVAIASSSEVEECFIGGHKLVTRSIMPVADSRVDAARISLTNTTGVNYADTSNPVDNVVFPGERLVLQLYEECDELNTPGPRARYITRGRIAALPTTAATARCLCRIPISGRTRAQIGLIIGNPGATVNLGLRLFKANFGVSKGFYVVEGALATGVCSPANLQFGAGATVANNFKVINAGDYAGNFPTYFDYDEFAVWAWDTAGGGIEFVGHADGDYP